MTVSEKRATKDERKKKDKRGCFWNYSP